jgi:hypothetical protein
LQPVSVFSESIQPLVGWIGIADNRALDGNRGFGTHAQKNSRSICMPGSNNVSDKLGPYGRVSDEQVFMQEVQ